MSFFVEIRDCNFIGKSKKIEGRASVRKGRCMRKRDSFEKGTKSERRMPRLSGGDEGRGKLRKVAGICKQDLIREYPNGATRQVEDLTLEQSRANPGN